MRAWGGRHRFLLKTKTNKQTIKKRMITNYLKKAVWSPPPQAHLIRAWGGRHRPRPLMSLNSDSSYKKKDYFKKQTDKTNKQTLITLSLNSDSSSDQKEKRNKQTIAKKGHTANAHLPRRGFEVWEILSNVCFHKVSEFHDSSDFWQIGWLDTLYCTRGRNFQSLTKMGFLCNDFVKSTFAC